MNPQFVKVCWLTPKTQREGFMEQKVWLQSEIEADEKEVAELKSQRRDLSRKVKLSELPAADQFKSLNQRATSSTGNPLLAASFRVQVKG